MHFDFYDFDRDGTIGSLDILNMGECAPKGSVIYKEVKMLSDYYITESMTRKINKRAFDFLKLETF